LSKDFGKIPGEKINIDNKAGFGYSESYCFCQFGKYLKIIDIY